MDLRQIRTFVHIGELRSFTRASAYLRVSQPALSRQMRLLEEELNLKLFSRHGHGVELTNDGITFLERCRNLLAEFEQLREDFRSHATMKEAVGTVSIGLPVPATRFVTPEMMESVGKQYPNLSVRFVEGFSAFLHEWLLSGSLDLAILFQPRTTKILTSEPLLVEDLFAIFSAKGRSRKKNFVDARDLQSTTLILPHRPHVLRDLIDGLCLKHQRIMEVDSTSLMIELARAGKGTTILPRGSVELAVRIGDVVALPIVNPTLSWQVSVCYSSVRPPTLGARIMLELIRKELYRRVATGEWVAGRITKANNNFALAPSGK